MSSNVKCSRHVRTSSSRLLSGRDPATAPEWILLGNEGRDIAITEAKSSAHAPLTTGQKYAFPEIEKKRRNSCELNRDHVYRVSSLGLLVHNNACAAVPPGGPNPPVGSDCLTRKLSGYTKKPTIKYGRQTRPLVDPRM